MSESTNMKESMPTALKWTIGLTALMLYRLTVLFRWGDLGEGIAQVWQIAMSGDIFVGLMALPVAYKLSKSRDLTAWTLGIMFQVIGIKDFTVGIQLAFLEPQGDGSEVIAGFLFVMMMVQFLCIYFLVRKRDYYIG